MMRSSFMTRKPFAEQYTIGMPHSKAKANVFCLNHNLEPQHLRPRVKASVKVRTLKHALTSSLPTGKQSPTG